MKIILVEDNKEDQSVCENAIKDFNDDQGLTVELFIVDNAASAIEQLKNSYFDAVIIDMKLSNMGGGDEGNQVISELKRTSSRMPVIIMTGTPAVAEQNGFPLIDVFKKGETTYQDIIKKLWYIYNTGITKIMGRKGVFEERLNYVFINHILPQLNKNQNWIEYAKANSEKTEKALIRYTLNHLIHVLDSDISECYPEEMYIWPTVSTNINTGCIVRCKRSENFYIVMSPACDLAVRENGTCKTDRAVFIQIQPLEEIFSWDENEWASLSNGKQKMLEKVYKNTKTLYYHWLPKASFYPGGVVNFRMITTYTEDQIRKRFDDPIAQISAPFLKDMVSRFSSYYARQGQPEIQSY